MNTDAGGFKLEYDLFISYPTPAYELAAKIYSALLADGIRIYFDRKSSETIAAREPYIKALSFAKNLLVVVTPDTPSADYQLLEINKGWKLWVRLNQLAQPVALYTNERECLQDPDLPGALASFEPVDLSDAGGLDNALERVRNLLKLRAGFTENTAGRASADSAATHSSIPSHTPVGGRRAGADLPATHSRALMRGVVGTLATGALGLALLKLSPLISEAEVASTGGLVPTQDNSKPGSQHNPAPPNDSDEAPPLSDGTASPKSEQIAREKAGTRKTKPKQRSIPTMQPSPHSLAKLGDNQPQHTNLLGVTQPALGRITVDVTGLGSVQLVDGSIQEHRWTQTLDVRRPPGEYVLAFRQSGQICERKVTLSDAQQLFQRTVGELCAEGQLSASVPGSEVEPKQRG